MEKKSPFNYQYIWVVHDLYGLCEPLLLISFTMSPGFSSSTRDHVPVTVQSGEPAKHRRPVLHAYTVTRTMTTITIKTYKVMGS